MTHIDERRLPPARNLEQLQETVWKLSRQILQMTTEAGSGHPSSSLSAIDVLTGLYFGGILRYDVERPDWKGRDRFILSKGHAAPALYAVLAEASYFDAEELSTLREIGSPLEGHPNRLALPGVEASTGSLGQGLSIGLGHALAARLDDEDYRVYVLIGDGESDEGQIWEAAMAGAKYQVDNLTAILDYNQYQQTGPVTEVMPSLEPVVDKWEAFGWDVREIDGHDMKQIITALQEVFKVKEQPQMIIAHTLKGRGLSPFANDNVNR
jgi:transketolase